MSFMPPTDSMFLLAESREHPMHVGGLQLFELPDGAGPDIVTELIETFRATDNISPTFRKRPAEPVSSLGNTWWKYDDTIDYDHHIRHSAVPQPGRIRELLQLTSRWHGVAARPAPAAVGGPRRRRTRGRAHRRLQQDPPLARRRGRGHPPDAALAHRGSRRSRLPAALVVAAAEVVGRTKTAASTRWVCCAAWARRPARSPDCCPPRPRSSARSSATATSRCRVRRRRS